MWPGYSVHRRNPVPIDTTKPQSGVIWAMDILGMSEDELYGYLKDLLHEEATEAAGVTGKSVEEELDSPGFAAAGAASTYAIKLILANNAFITRQLLDLGLIQGNGDAESESDAE
jgi:hypothetical protein